MFKNECALFNISRPENYGFTLDRLLEDPEPVYFCDNKLRSNLSSFSVKIDQDAKGVRVKALGQDSFQKKVFSSVHSVEGFQPWFNNMSSVYDPQQDYNPCMNILPNSICGQNVSHNMDPASS